MATASIYVCAGISSRVRKKITFPDGFDLGAGATGGVDGFLVLASGGGWRLLADHHGLPVLRYPTHLSLCLSLTPTFLSLKKMFQSYS